MTIPTWIENFRVVSTGNKSVKVYDSVINTPFGAIKVEGKTFSDVADKSFIMLQMNYQIKKTLWQIKVIGIDPPSGNVPHSGRLYRSNYVGLEATFVYGKPDESGNMVDADGSVINRAFGADYEIEYIGVARIDFINKGKDTERKKIRRLLGEKMIVPFHASYYGLGEQD